MADLKASSFDQLPTYKKINKELKDVKHKVSAKLLNQSSLDLPREEDKEEEEEKKLDEEEQEAYEKLMEARGGA